MKTLPTLRRAPRAPLIQSLAGLALLVAALLPQSASAIPLFNRQTGQNCVACHAGGQFPELTNYGRLFKMTGYTLGERTAVPLSGMALASVSKVANTSKSEDPAADFQKNGKLIFATASLFVGGKITDNIGAFAQFTYDPYASQTDSGAFKGHAGADNIDVRYADRLVSADQDLIFGVSANNNPSIADPWNTAAAWMQYVPVPSPTSSQYIDGATPYPGLAAGGNIAGLTAYAFWNQLVYVEAGAYRTASGIFSLMKAGVPTADMTKLHGNNPYVRLALSRNFGAHSLMLGATRMTAQIYDDPADTSSTTTLHHNLDTILDAQYQYQLDPHAITGQLVFARNAHRGPDLLPCGCAQDRAARPLAADGTTAPMDVTHVLRVKGSYVWQAKYGGSLAYFDLTATTDGLTPLDNPATRGMTYEAFWMPLQYMRVGLQYTSYSRFAGARNNYDGAGRNAADNNSMFLYLWAAY